MRWRIAPTKQKSYFDKALNAMSRATRNPPSDALPRCGPSVARNIGDESILEYERGYLIT